MNLSSQKLLLIKTPWLNYFIVDCTDDTSEIVWTCSQKLICVFLCPTHLRASFIWTSFLFRLKLQYKVCDATNASKLERWSVTVSKRVVLFWCEVMPKWNPVLLMNRCNFSKYVWKKYGCGREMSDIKEMIWKWNDFNSLMFAFIEHKVALLSYSGYDKL